MTLGIGARLAHLVLALATVDARQDGGDLIFRVLDPEDHPIAGALAFSHLRSLDPSDPTNAQGWGVLKEWNGQSQIIVVAPHFRLATLDVARGRSTPPVAHLKRANALQLTVRSRDGSVAKDVVVVVRTEGRRIFPQEEAGTLGTLHQRYFVTGAMCGTGGSKPEGRPELFYGAFHPAEEGRLVLEDVYPNLKLSIDVVDQILTSLVPRFEVKIGEDEHASLEKTIDAELQDVVVRVLDEHGAGVPDARVLAISIVRPVGKDFPDWDFGPRKTDSTGAWRLGGIRSTYAAITVKKEGFQAWYRANVAVGPENPSIECVLTRSARD